MNGQPARIVLDWATGTGTIGYGMLSTDIERRCKIEEFSHEMIRVCYINPGVLSGNLEADELQATLTTLGAILSKLDHMLSPLSRR